MRETTHAHHSRNAIVPFQCATPQAIVDDLRERLARTRWPDQLDGAEWDYGTEREYLRELCAYWADQFDWHAAEARFNAYPQYMTQVDGENLHFYHIRSPEPDAIPLVIVHGYPGSVTEFLEVFGPLSDPARYGGSRRDAFHVIAPSIPGYGWSGPTQRQGFDTNSAAAAFVTLMERLGYSRYVVQGGDWGARIVTAMAEQRPDRVASIHLNMIGGSPPDPNDPLAGLTDDEIAYVTWKKAYDARESGYYAIQSTKPQSLAYGLTDSPAGLAGWIVEKFRTWSDCDGEVERAFSKDQLLENIMLYWVTGTINSAMRLYYESLGPGRFSASLGERLMVPTGHAQFPGDIRRTPRAWAERAYNIVHWKRMPQGGHFAALEQPQLFVDELRGFFSGFR